MGYLKRIILTIILLGFIQPVFSAENKVVNDVSSSKIFINTDLNDKLVSLITFEPLTDYVQNINSNSENFWTGYQKATERYTQSNVVAAYKDFSAIINNPSEKNDFLYMALAQRLDNLGFFTLGQNAIINIEDNSLWYYPVNSLKKLYNPAVTLTYDEEIYLAQLHTASLYNNSAKETIKTLTKDDKILKKSDYANYVLSVAYFENKDYSKSLNAINKAINKAPECMNYLRFKEKIYTQTEDYKNALKIIKQIKNSDTHAPYFDKLVQNDELYILMKISKKDKAKYYSAKLLYQTGEYQKAIKEAQAAITVNKKNFAAYTLIGDCYLKTKDIEKAQEFYMKSYEINKKYSPTLLGLGNICYIQKDYKTASDYYKNAYKYAPNDEFTILCLANDLISAQNNIDALFYVKKTIKLYPTSSEAYYLLSILEPDKKEQNLKMTLSLNPMNVRAWMALAEMQIEAKNYKKAGEYLLPVELMDGTNPQYTYLKQIIETQNGSRIRSSYGFENFNADKSYNFVF